MNKGMNNSVESYAPQGKHYGGTSCLLIQVLISTGVQLVGHHLFWTSTMNLLEVVFSPQLYAHMLSLDKEKVVQFHRDYNYKNKAKRKRLGYEKFRNEYLPHQKDIPRNATYKLLTGCLDTPSSTCAHIFFGFKGKQEPTRRSATEKFRNEYLAYQKMSQETLPTSHLLVA